MLQKFVSVFGGDPNKRTVEKLASIVDEINALEPEFEKLSDEALRAKTDEFRAQLSLTRPLDTLSRRERGRGEAEGGMHGEGGDGASPSQGENEEGLEEILPQAFAAVREASKRTIGLRPYDVQMLGGVVLHRGGIAEMRTGEGKTLVATLPLYLNALSGRGVHLVTVNDYLARRDARWMGPIFQMLGLSVGVLQMAAATENGKKAFLVDFEKESPHEDQHHLRLVDRAEAYRADITYGTNSEFGFDYLRDNMTMRLADRVQRGHYYAIVDEVDNVLIDEARTPLIISGPASGDLEWYGKMSQIVKQLKLEDYEVNEKDRAVSLTEIGVAHVEALLGQPLLDPDRPEDVTPEQARLTGYLEQALRAQHLFKRNKDYLVQGGKVVIVDEFTGRLMPGRRWSDGLHQAVEAKEGVRVEPENVTYATITLQNYFRMYAKLAGMTGTALTESEEFHKIYKLEVMPVPTNLEYQAFGKNAALVEVRKKDEENYEYTYYARREDGEKNPILYRRKDYPDVIYRTVESKLRALAAEIVRYHALGRPLLVGTTSVESSDRLSNRLRAESVRRLLQVGLVRHAFMEANQREEDGRLIPELQPFNEPLEKITPDALRKFGSSFGMTNINLDDPDNLARLREILNLPEEVTDRLKSILQSGVPHQVLNARKHTEESQIIAGAGAFGAVTIATNMAGRGVDIKLGGEIAEEVISAVNRVLRRVGIREPFDLTLEERRQALLRADPSQYGLYEGEVKLFLQYFEDMERVKQLGGLHVIGSERHEARRIDNQLRGRAARQGDPGSSRFYLSLEDDLMRLFGGEQVSGLMQRLKVDDTLPLEARMVSGIIESSQHRVEGANFDVRKHLLEYDDVLNKQREQIYSQRDRIFTKQDLSEDVAEMLEAEVEARVKAALADEEGPWKLIAWLEGVQPPFESEGRLFPSFGLGLVLDKLNASSADSKTALLELIKEAVQAEQAHALRAIETLVDRTEEGLEAQIGERMDALDAFFEGLRDSQEPVRPQKVAEELSGLIHLPLRLSGEQSRQLAEDPRGFKEWLEAHVEAQLTELSAARVAAAVEHRFGEGLGGKVEASDWDEAAEKLLGSSRELMQRQLERLTSQVERDIDSALQRESGQDDSSKLRLLLSLSQGARTLFDSKTHRQVRQVFNRFSFVYLAARSLEGRSAEDVTEAVLDHLEGAETALQTAWGQGEYGRLSQNAARLADFGPAAQVFGEARQNEAPSALSGPDREALIQAIGSYILNEVKRQLLLSAITELWVEYLTKVEALRVSIGLEAYAQRDPLVQYKGRASELFHQLLADVRAAVIGRVFSYQPRRVEIAPTEVAESPAGVQTQASQGEGAKKKRRRH
jgi:preprotein translocase subunit SecA